MTEESRGKRRKQANPRRNQGKSRAAALESLKELVKDAAADVAAAQKALAFQTRQLRTLISPSGRLMHRNIDIFEFGWICDEAVRSVQAGMFLPGLLPVQSSNEGAV